MIFVLNRQGKVIAVLKNGGVGNTTPFFDDSLIENLETGSETFKFSSILNEETGNVLTTGNYIAFKKNNNYKLFQIVEINEVHQETLEIEVYCECAGLELLNSVVRAKKLVSADLRTFAKEVLLDTGWNVGLIDGTNNIVRDLDIPSNSVYGTLQNFHKLFDVELEFRCEINQGRISSKFVDFYGRRGRNIGKRFEFSKNIAGLRRTSSIAELYTALIGEGTNGLTFKDIQVEGIDKPLGQDFVIDEEAYNNFNHNGRHLMGIFKFETESPEELLRETKKKLEEVSKPKVVYEVNVELLNTQINIGDTVNIVDFYFNPPILLQARVNQLETSITNPQADKCILSNFVEVTTNINGDLLGQLGDYIDSSISSKFPISGNDIQDGAITGDKIYQDSITTEHIKANSIDADRIQANSIKTQHLEAHSITADKIQTGTITAESGIIGSLSADVITTGTLNAAFVNVTNLDASNITTGVLDAKHINVTNLDASNIVAGVLDASIINVINLSASSITTGTLDANIIDVINLNASSITAGTLDANLINVTNLNASSITTGTLDASKVNVTNIDASNITSGSINADLIEGLVISADMITTGTLDASKANIININASNITSGKISADLIEGMEITADMITVGTLDASLVNVINLNASNINTGSLDASKVKVSNLNAGSIIGGTLDASKINVSNLSASSITSGTINGQVVNVTNLNASNITSGAIDTSKLNISSRSGNLSISNNTIQIKDKQEQVRVQIGEDKAGDYNMYVYSPKGVLMFDAVYGVTADGISNNSVGGDKIKDESVTSNKLVIDEIFSNSAWIGELQAIELKAEQITTGKISGEHIDIAGLISFDSLNTDMKENFIFDTTGNKTFINGGQLFTNSVTAEKINAKGLTVLDESNNTTFNIDNKGEVFVTGTIQSANYSESSKQGYKITKDGNITMNNAIVRGDVLLPNAGITNFNNKEINEVRFWAGDSFENRYVAPFQVLQDGSFIATKGEIGGTFTGELHIGNIHITDTNTTEANFEIKTNNNVETIVKLTDKLSFIDSSFIFGNSENKIIMFDKPGKDLKFFGSSVTMQGESQNEYLTINKNSLFESFKDGIKHKIIRDNEVLKFETNGDGDNFIFANDDGNVKVDIQGRLNVDDTIWLGEMKITKRTEQGNEGVDFIL